MSSNDLSGAEPRLGHHRDCQVLTKLVYDSLPHDQSLGHLRRRSKGEFVWTAENSDHCIYFLKRGQVAIMLNDSAGCEVILRLIEPGEPFGELCFCAQRLRPRGNCAKTVVDSELLRIDFSDFMIHLRQHPVALEAFTFTFCQRLADAERRIEVLSHRGAEARLGRLLLQLASSHGLASTRRQGEVQLPIGHDELARMAAMTRPHVSVTMGKLRARGLVHYDRASQLTVDVRRLKEHLNSGKGTE